MKIALIISLIFFCITDISMIKYRLACKLIGKEISNIEITISKILEYLSVIFCVISLSYILSIDWYWCVFISIAIQIMLQILYIPTLVHETNVQTESYLGKGIICFIIGGISFLLGFFIL